MNDVFKRLLIDGRVDDLSDHAVGLPLGRFGEFVEQLGLADHLLGVFHQFAVDLLFGSHAHTMRNVHE